MLLKVSTDALDLFESYFMSQVLKTIINYYYLYVNNKSCF